MFVALAMCLKRSCHSLVVHTGSPESALRGPSPPAKASILRDVCLSLGGHMCVCVRPAWVKQKFKFYQLLLHKAHLAFQECSCSSQMYLLQNTFGPGMT